MCGVWPTAATQRRPWAKAGTTLIRPCLFWFAFSMGQLDRELFIGQSFRKQETKKTTTTSKLVYSVVDWQLTCDLRKVFFIDYRTNCRSFSLDAEKHVHIIHVVLSPSFCLGFLSLLAFSRSRAASFSNQALKIQCASTAPCLPAGKKERFLPRAMHT